MLSNKIRITLIILIMYLQPNYLVGAIYVCVDEAGIRHYSDRKCPSNKIVKAEVIDDLGKTSIPNSILEFTAIIKIVKSTLALVKSQIPDNKLYQRAYSYSLVAEKAHADYLSKSHKKHPNNYNPFEPVKLVNIIAAISHGCRSQAYMTICAAIEGNYWLNGEEQIYLKNRLDNGLQYVVTETNKKLYCEKAKLASRGGVVSRRMVNYFCEQSN